MLGPKIGGPAHRLAAGALGAAKAPPAPLKAGLSQALVWDGRDDRGRNVSSGVYFVRVATLGNRATAKITLTR